MDNRTFDNIDLESILSLLKERITNFKYVGDLSDLGNEIGFIVGKHYSNFDDEDISNFISGFKHGISLTNGTH